MARSHEDSQKSDQIRKARERSVNNLQRLYGVVVSLAIAIALKALFDEVFGTPSSGSGKGLTNFSAYYEHFLRTVSFIVTVVPFFHGANRYLDKTYVTGESSAKKYALLIDFIALFAEALLIFVLGMYTRIDNNFYTVLSFLLILDILWVISTYFTASEDKPEIKWWAIVNIIAVGFIFLSLWSFIFNTSWSFWASTTAMNCMLCFVCIVRTFFDYYLVWSFYYPEFTHIPAPLPARPPRKSAEPA